MHVLSILVTIVTGYTTSIALAASIPLAEKYSGKEARSSASLTGSIGLTNVTSHTSPWPPPPWTYTIPGPTPPPNHLTFSTISPLDPGLEGQQATLHACDSIIRWLWAHYTPTQTVDKAILQKADFVGASEGSVVIVFVPLTVPRGAGGEVVGVMGRELALDCVRALEALVWRFGGRGLVCEVVRGGEVVGRIEIDVRIGGGGDSGMGVDSE